MTVATLAQQVSFGPLSNAATRFFSSSEEKRQLTGYLWITKRILHKTTTLFLLCLGVAAIGLWLANLKAWCVLVLAASAFALLFGWTSILNGMQNAARQRAIVALHGGIGQWLRFGLAAVAVLAFGRSAVWAITGYVAAALFILASQFVFFRREIAPRTRLDSNPKKTPFGLEHEMTTYGLPFALWGIVMWAQQSADRWALQTFNGAAEVGQYQALNQLAFQPIFLWAGFAVQLISPIVFSWAGDGREALRLNRAHRLNLTFVLCTLLLAGLAAAVAGRYHEFIFLHLVAAPYRGISGMMAVMVLSGGFCAAGQVMSIALMTGKKTSRLLAPRIGTGLVGVLLMLAGAKYCGVPGVVWAGLASYAAYFMWISAIVWMEARTLSPLRFNAAPHTP
jgi:O-antigen/teichoic acid export membrane protein